MEHFFVKSRMFLECLSCFFGMGKCFSTLKCLKMFFDHKDVQKINLLYDLKKIDNFKILSIFILIYNYMNCFLSFYSSSKK
jgi:hypothetical protein